MILVMIIAFATGFSVVRGNVCAVGAIKNGVKGNFLPLVFFAIAISISGLVLALLTWILGRPPLAYQNYEIALKTFLGGAVFGLGAWINKACVLGTLAGFARGNYNYSATFIGLCFGAVAGRILFKLDHSCDKPILLTPSFLGFAIVFLYGVIVFWGIKSFRASTLTHATYRENLNALAMLVIAAILASIMYFFYGEWNYLERLIYISESFLGLRVWSVSSVVSALELTFSVFAGAVLAGRVWGKFKPISLDLRQFVIKFLGGGAMGIASSMIPGGNESMMFLGVPYLSVNSLVAYLAMMITIILLCCLFDRPKDGF